MSESELTGGMKYHGRFILEAFDKDGNHLWTETEEPNIVVNEGIQRAMDSGIVPTTWYVGLMGNVSPTATTVLSDLTGTEITAYSEAARQAWTKVRTNQTLSNTASTADFTINADSTVVYGAFICSASSGSVGTLLAAKQFGSSKTFDTSDVLKVTYEITGSSS